MVSKSLCKASNAGQGDSFGYAVSLSSDGKTLAASAPGESSDAKGINGDENNDASPSSGAVYVYRLSENQWSQQAYAKASNADVGDMFGASLFCPC